MYGDLINSMSLIIDALEKSKKAHMQNSDFKKAVKAMKSQTAPTAAKPSAFYKGTLSRFVVAGPKFKGWDADLFFLNKDRKWAVISSAVAGVLFVAIVWTLSSKIVDYWTIESKVQNQIAASYHPAKQAVVKPDIPAGEQPFLKKQELDGRFLEGIFWDKDDPVCLIQGKICHLGDIWDGKRITLIVKKQVMLEDDTGNVYYLKSPV